MSTHVDVELSKAACWRHRPDYLFNQLNIKSAIVYPGNREIMSIGSGGYSTYTMK